MSPLYWVVIAIFAVIVIVAVIPFTVGFTTALGKQVAMRRLPKPDELIPSQTSEAPPVADDAQPQAIDPDNPPRYQVYNPRRYDPEKAVRCTCHGIPAAKGETMLLWPIPGHPEGGMDVFCSRTYGITLKEQQ